MPDPDDLVRLGFGRAGAAVSITDPSGRLQYANEAFTELFGWAADDDVHISVITPEDERAWLASYVGRLVDGTEDEYRTVKRFVRRDGTDFSGTVVVRAIRRQGVCVGLVGHVAPTERRELVGDPRVGKLLQHSASTITLVDADGEVIETAGRYRATLGYPPEFWETRSVFDVLLPDDVATVLELREAIMADPHEVVTTDVHVVDAAGVVQTLESTAVNLLDDPDVRGIVITSRNVTEERSTREQMERLRDQAVAEAERGARLIATVSHELRNPLHALAGLSELLASDAELAGTSRSIASTLHREVAQMARVTDDLLEHTRLELGASEARIEPTRVRDLLDDVVALGRAAVGDRPVALNAAVRTEVPNQVATDGSRLHQLVWNLVENAVKFTPRGRVDVVVASCTTGSGLPGLRIEVSDTGAGIDAVQLDRIFEPFHTTAPAIGRSGAGLGLSITLRILDLLNGTITVESAVGRGSSFVVEIPAEPVHDDAGSTAATDPASDGDSDEPVVLVVEDNAVNQQLARHQLERIRMRPLIAGSAEEAIELLRTLRVDAILMDHQLPGMNGREATRELRRRGIDTPIVGITASATAADEQACLDAGMNAFLPKPVGLEQLRGALASLVGPDSASSTSPATADPPAEVDIVDERTLSTLADELGDLAIVTSLVNTFLGELDQRRHDIIAADADTAARQAHSLKSSARMLGAFPLADACEALEARRVDAGEVIRHADAAETAFRGWLDQPAERSEP